MMNTYVEQKKEIFKNKLSTYFYSDNFGFKSDELLEIIEIDLRRAFKQITSKFFPSIYSQVEEFYENENLSKKEQHELSMKKIRYEIFKDKENEFQEFIRNLENYYREILFKYVEQKYKPVLILSYKKDGMILLHSGIKNDNPEIGKEFLFNENYVYKYLKVKNNETIFYSSNELPEVKGNWKYISNYIKEIISLKISPEDYFKKSRAVSEYIRTTWDINDKNEFIKIIQKFLGGYNENKILNYQNLKFVDKNKFQTHLLRKYDFYKIYSELILPFLELNYSLERK